MTIDAVKQYGVTLLASAGAAGIIAGLALQPLLTNLIAGIQIAITQPIRIDDAVIVEGEVGLDRGDQRHLIVVVRLWDLRRMILPLTYFMQKPFRTGPARAPRSSGRRCSTSTIRRRSTRCGRSSRRSPGRPPDGTARW